MIKYENYSPNINIAHLSKLHKSKGLLSSNRHQFYTQKNQYLVSDHISFYLEGYINKEVKKEKTKYIIPFRDGRFIAYKSA